MKTGLHLTLIHSFISVLLLLTGNVMHIAAQPVLSNIENSDILYNAGQGEVQVTNSIRISGFLISSATISISGGYNQNEDLLTYKGTKLRSSWDKSTGVMTLSGSGSSSDYRSALRAIYYENTNVSDPSSGTRKVSFRVSNFYGNSNTLSRDVIIHKTNIAPVLGNLETDDVVFCMNSGSIVITQSITITDSDNTTLKSARVTITEGYTATEDKLLFTNQSGISGIWDVNTGQLSLTGESSLDNYRDALRSIRYENTNSGNPHAGYHDIMFTVNDGVSESNTISRSIVQSVPTAVISGDFSICIGNAAALEITFTGSAPWDFSYARNSGTPVNIRDISSNPYFLSVSREGSYTLTSVNDRYCPGKVSGTAVVDLLPATEVNIVGLESVYTRQSTDMIPLTGEPAGGVFSGPGVIPYGDSWFFIPSLPEPGVYDIVYKYRPDEASCYGYDTAVVRILEKSAAIEIENDRTRFCKNDLPFGVTGINLLNDNPGTFSITGGKGLKDHGNNTATVFPDSLQINEYTVTYTAPDGNPASQVIEIGRPLTADFKWSAECFEPDQPVIFTSTTSSPFGYLTEDSYNWTIRMDTDSVSFTSENLTYTFLSTGNYDVKLHIRNSNGCIDEIMKVFPLRPVYALAENIYSEDFEGEQHWETGYNQALGSDSWKLGKPDNLINGFSDPHSGEYCWFTDLTMNPIPREQSWITSPCFDFTGTDKPTLVAHIRRSFTDNRDGANFSYSTDNGQQWNLLGSLNDGINWFNGYFGNPGTQTQGWTAITDHEWKETRHILDFLKDEPIVQFRIYFIASGSALGNKGIAVDDIKIVERNRTIVVEHFTNTTQKATEADDMVDEMAQLSGTGMIDLKYHVSDQEDPFYLFNPVVSNARQFYYGLTNFPYSVINGGTRSNQNIDYINSNLSPGQLGIEALYDSDFNLEVTSMPDGNRLYAEVIITALQEVPLSELSVRLAVIEPLIIDSSASPDSVHRNVVRAMLPDAAGNSIYRAWQKDESYRIVEYWEPNNVFNAEGLKVVAFLQNEMTKEIYQASVDERGLINSIRDQLQPVDHIFNAFPNPANSYLTIEFISEPSSKRWIELVNNMGQIVYRQMVSGSDHHSFSLTNFPGGVYLLQVIQDNGNAESRKIIISH